MNNAIIPGNTPPPADELASLIQRYIEIEGALQAAINGQIDAVVDPANAKPILLSQAQRALRDSEARYRRLLSRINALVFELEPDGTIRFVNDAAAALTGYPLQDVQGRNWWELLLVDGQRWQGDDLEARFRRGDVTNYELEVTGRNGATLTLELNSANHYGPDGRLELIVGLAIDISGRKQIEEMRRQHMEAQEALRLRDEFLSIAAHELKTPLTSLLGYAQVLQRRLQREGRLQPRDQHALNMVISQSRRLNDMVCSLLDISRIQAGQLNIRRAAMDLCALVRRLALELAPTLDKHRIEFDCPDEGAWIEGDELRLEQALQNLLQNAIKYSPDGGAIRVSVRGEGAWARITVADEGIGIPAAAQPHLFQRFYRAGNVEAQSISGIGIGLFVVKEIVGLHGGTIAFESTEGQGSSFTISLPRPLADAEAEQPAGEQAKSG